MEDLPEVVFAGINIYLNLLPLKAVDWYYVSATPSVDFKVIIIPS